MGKNLSVSALRSVEKLRTDILEYGAKSVFPLKPKHLKTRSSSLNTSTWHRKYELIPEGDMYCYRIRCQSTLL